MFHQLDLYVRFVFIKYRFMTLKCRFTVLKCRFTEGKAQFFINTCIIRFYDRNKERRIAAVTDGDT